MKNNSKDNKNRTNEWFNTCRKYNTDMRQYNECIESFTGLDNVKIVNKLRKPTKK